MCLSHLEPFLHEVKVKKPNFFQDKSFICWSALLKIILKRFYIKSRWRYIKNFNRFQFLVLSSIQSKNLIILGGKINMHY
jgi:hypothetical protein